LPTGLQPAPTLRRALRSPRARSCSLHVHCTNKLLTSTVGRKAASKSWPEQMSCRCSPPKLIAVRLGICGRAAASSAAPFPPISFPETPTWHQARGPAPQMLANGSMYFSGTSSRFAAEPPPTPARTDPGRYVPYRMSVIRLDVCCSACARAFAPSSPISLPTVIVRSSPHCPHGPPRTEQGSAGLSRYAVPTYLEGSESRGAPCTAMHSRVPSPPPLRANCLHRTNFPHRVVPQTPFRWRPLRVSPVGSPSATACD
jgi:hypothetical protein